jgi:hypothetical protein
VGFEPTIAVLERAKTVRALYRAATAIGHSTIWSGRAARPWCSQGEIHNSYMGNSVGKRWDGREVNITVNIIVKMIDDWHWLGVVQNAGLWYWGVGLQRSAYTPDATSVLLRLSVNLYFSRCHWAPLLWLYIPEVPGLSVGLTTVSFF